MKLIVVCSNKPPAFANSGQAHHLRREGEKVALCGRQTSEWLIVGDANQGDIDSSFCCQHCQKKAGRP